MRREETGGLFPQFYNINFKTLNKRMIAVNLPVKQDNQQLSEYEPSEIDNQSINMQQESFDPQLQRQQEDLPILKQYLSTDYKIFQDKNVALSQITLIKNKVDFEKKRDAIRGYFASQQSNNGTILQYRKQKDQISSEFVLNFTNMPSHSIIYVSINELKGERCNILVHNSNGECLAYFFKQRKCKKLPKIFKLLSRVKKPAMAFILDSTTQQQANIPQIEKLSNFVSDFLYIFQNAQHIQVKMHGNNLRSESIEQKEENCSIQLTDNHLRIISPNISSITETDAIDILTQNIKGFKHQEALALQEVRGLYEENQRNLEFDFIFINLYRIFQCTPKQTIVKIQNLFMKQQQVFNQKDSIQKQKQIQREYNKDSNSHFPYKMKQSKACKRCQLSYKKKLTKINYGCEGCSIQFKKDIHLCPQCFAEFHENMDFYSPRIRLGRLNTKKRSAKKALQKNDISEGEIADQANQMKITKANTIHKNEMNKKQSKIGQKQLQSNDKIIKLDRLLTETFQITNKYIQKGHLKLMQGFLSTYLDKSLQKMNEITKKQANQFLQTMQNGREMEQKQQKRQQKKGNQLSLFGSLVYENICKHSNQKIQNSEQGNRAVQSAEIIKNNNTNEYNFKQLEKEVKQQYQF